MPPSLFPLFPMWEEREGKGEGMLYHPLFLRTHPIIDSFPPFILGDGRPWRIERNHLLSMCFSYTQRRVYTHTNRRRRWGYVCTCVRFSLIEFHWLGVVVRSFSFLFLLYYSVLLIGDILSPLYSYPPPSYLYKYIVDIFHWYKYMVKRGEDSLYIDSISTYIWKKWIRNRDWLTCHIVLFLL